MSAKNVFGSEGGVIQATLVLLLIGDGEKPFSRVRAKRRLHESRKSLLKSENLLVTTFKLGQPIMNSDLLDIARRHPSLRPSLSTFVGREVETRC